MPYYNTRGMAFLVYPIDSVAIKRVGCRTATHGNWPACLGQQGPLGHEPQRRFAPPTSTTVRSGSEPDSDSHVLGNVLQAPTGEVLTASFQQTAARAGGELRRHLPDLLRRRAHVFLAWRGRPASDFSSERRRSAGTAANGNLLLAMTFDDAARARIARGWMNSSLDQPTYAAQHGISERTLRDWVGRFGGGRRPHAQLRAAIVASIEQFQSVLAALDAEAAADTAGAAHDAEDAERHAGLEPPVPPADVVSAPPEVLPAVPPKLPDADTAGLPDVPSPANTAVVVDSAGSAPTPCAPIASEYDLAPSHGNGECGVVDLDALRKRARQLRAARAASPRRNPFLDWGE